MRDRRKTMFGIMGLMVLAACMFLVCADQAPALQQDQHAPQVLTLQELRIESPNGRYSIHLKASDQRAQMTIFDKVTGNYVADYVGGHERAAVASVGNMQETARNHAVHMAMTSSREDLQIVTDSQPLFRLHTDQPLGVVDPDPVGFNSQIE